MDRREFLQALALGSTTLISFDVASLGKAFAQAPAQSFSAQNRDRIAYLMGRITYGVSPDLYEHAYQIGETAFLEEQLNPETIDDTDTEALLVDYPIYGMTSAEIYAQYDNDRGPVIQELIGLTLARAIGSKRGLYEMMVDFWSNHFNIYIGKGFSLYLKIADDRDVIRPHAMGKFRDLLLASAKSPAMVFYLDNAQSSRENPNENYAREVLELHTLGVNGGYTETDVKEVARALTGWSIVRPQDGDENGFEFVFRPFFHDTQPVTVMGRTFDASGITIGEQVLEYLASHPSTAWHISEKLVRHFVADVPPQTLVAQCTETFMATDGDIRAVLRTLFNSEEFWTALPKFKRPMDYFVGVLRALAYQPSNPNRFRRMAGEALQALGQVPFNWPAPNGYPDVSSYWMQNLLPRWNLPIASMVDTKIGQPNYERLAQLASATTLDAYDFLGTYLLGRTLTQDERSVVESFANEIGKSDTEKNQAALALLLASPAFQYR